MSRSSARLLAFLVAAPLAACATGRVAEPEELTLEAALESVGAGLARMKEAQGDVTTGLVPAEVTVTFRVKASASQSSTLVVDAGPAVGGTPLVSFGGEASAAASSERGNQVVVKFSNVLFAPDDVLLSARSPDELERILEALGRRGIHLYVK